MSSDIQKLVQEYFNLVGRYYSALDQAKDLDPKLVMKYSLSAKQDLDSLNLHLVSIFDQFSSQKEK